MAYDVKRLYVPYTPEQNGKVERENQIVEAARTMLCAKDLDVSLWAEAVNIAVYTLNMTGTSSEKGKPPYELYYKVVPDIKHLRVFGTVVYTHIPKQKSQKGIFVGYTNNTKGYRVWYSKTNKISMSRDIIFENEYDKNENLIVDKLEFTDAPTRIKDNPVKVESTMIDNRSGMVLRDRNTLKAPIRYNVSSFIANCDQPLNRNEAITGPHKHKWANAMNDEINSLHENNNWQLVDLPQKKVALRNAWVFKTKYKTYGNIDKFKASRYLAKPTKAHWNLIKRIIRSVKRTFNYGLYFNNNTQLSLEIYSDADYAGDIQTRRSTSGYLFRYGSSIISWTSQRRHSVSLSSTEAEYISASEAIKGIMWITRLITSLSKTGDKQPVLYIENQSAIRLVKNPEFHKRTKHIDVRYHFIREKYEDGQFQLQYIGTEDQIADILTKPLVKERFKKLRSAIGVTTIKEIIN